MAARCWPDMPGCFSVAVVVMMVAVACGGDDAAGEAGTSVTTSPDVSATTVADVSVEFALDPEADVVAAMIVDRLSPGRALEAVLLALDVGYGVDQIMDGAAVLEADGTIPGVAPDGPVRGVFSDGPQAAGGVAGVLAASPGLVLVVAADEERPTVRSIAEDLERDFALGGRIVGGTKETLSDTERENTKAMVGLVLTLIHTGYSLEQIVEGVVFGEYRWTLGVTSAEGRPDGGDAAQCVVMASSDGTLITPANRESRGALPSSIICGRAIRGGTVKVRIEGRWVDAVTTTTTATTTPTTTVAALTFPTNYTVDGTHTLRSSNLRGECVTDYVLTVTLFADGSVEGRMEGSSYSLTTESRDGVNWLKCIDPITTAWDLFGTHEGGSIELMPTANPDYVWRGSYESDHFVIDEWKILEGVTGGEEEWKFVLDP